ncbi:hypothetical protein L6164_014973 [Bauhinia variegata]|uniref:Uncharacterized protein n=1 Tax=Bauhinia variegata TaxID=167791 RepID=A0ACB9NIV4_BAUVA|nr:hypothetical protein L6164_014973 [Bauhinia variegata]
MLDCDSGPSPTTIPISRSGRMGGRSCNWGKMHSTSQPPELPGSDLGIIDTNSSTPRVYQVWEGRNRFYLGGRVIFGPDARSLFLTVFLIVAPVILFCAFVSQRLINEFPHHLGNLIVAIGAVFTVYVILLLFITSGIDPGIIPRNSHPLELDDEVSSISAYWAGSQCDATRLPPTRDVVVNGVVIQVKYCQTCMLYRPPRCSHCSICNNCVERFDHHCPWVGQCIGKRNYRFFFMFVSSTTMLCLYVFAFCWVGIWKTMESYHCDLWRALRKSPVSVFLIVYTFIGAWFVGGLTAFHLYLIFTNQTTYENFRYRYAGRMNPYNRGCTQNICELFFSKIPKSKNNFRARAKGDSSPTFTKSMSSSYTTSLDLPNLSFDLEMMKRQAFAPEDFESISGLGSWETHSRQTDLDHKVNWEISPDLQIFGADLDIESGITDRQKFHKGY